MDEQVIQDEFSSWFSTYGVITSQRILGHFQIDLPQKELIEAIKNTTSLYHLLVQVPLKNVLNGIIFQQANDYHIYVQKLFIDYLLSGESGKPPEAQGASTRESIEDERKNLVTVGEEFNQKQLEHEQFIASSQNELIRLAKNLKSCIANTATLLNDLAIEANTDISSPLIDKAIIHALIYCSVVEQGESFNKTLFLDKINDILKINWSAENKNDLEIGLEEFFLLIKNAHNSINELLERVDDITQLARSFRTQFYNTALHVIELINLLPEYRIDAEQDKINRESLYFDKNIGES